MNRSIWTLLLLLPTAAFAQDPVTDSRRTAVVRAVERVEPSVVSIHVVHREPVLYRYADPFERFFPLSPFGPRYYRGERDRVSSGSGFVVGGGRVLFF